MARYVSTRLRRAVILGIVAGATAFLTGCGGSDSATGPTPAAAPAPAPAPVTSVIFSGGDALPSKFIIFYPFTTTATGTIGATVDWTFATNDVDLFLARGTDPCSVAQFNNNTCVFLGSATSTTSKPERVSVPNLAAGPYTLYIANYGATQESMSFEITLTRVPGASASSTPVTGRLKADVRGMARLR